MRWQKDLLAQQQAEHDEQQTFDQELANPAPMTSHDWMRLLLRLEQASPGRGAYGVLQSHLGLRARQGREPCLTADECIDTERVVRDRSSAPVPMVRPDAGDTHVRQGDPSPNLRVRPPNDRRRAA